MRDCTRAFDPEGIQQGGNEGNRGQKANSIQAMDLTEGNEGNEARAESWGLFEMLGDRLGSGRLHDLGFFNSCGFVLFVDDGPGLGPVISIQKGIQQKATKVTKGAPGCEGFFGALVFGGRQFA